MKTKIVFILSYLFTYILIFSNAFAENIDASEYTYVNFNDFLTSYNSNVVNLITSKYDDKIIDITGNSTATYLNPSEKYISFVVYRSS